LLHSADNAITAATSSHNHAKSDRGKIHDQGFGPILAGPGKGHGRWLMSDIYRRLYATYRHPLSSRAMPTEAAEATPNGGEGYGEYATPSRHGMGQTKTICFMHGKLISSLI
jgi:hypothetical protein